MMCRLLFRKSFDWPQQIQIVSLPPFQGHCQTLMKPFRFHDVTEKQGSNFQDSVIIMMFTKLFRMLKIVFNVLLCRAGDVWCWRSGDSDAAPRSSPPNDALVKKSLQKHVLHCSGLRIICSLLRKIQLLSKQINARSWKVMEDVPRLRVGLGLTQRSQGNGCFFGVVWWRLKLKWHICKQLTVPMVGWLRCFFLVATITRGFLLYIHLDWI